MSTAPSTHEIEDLTRQIMELKKRLQEAQQGYPNEVVGDYTFRTWDGGTAKLSDLFGDRNDLLLVHNMGKACAYCTLWADGLNGLVRPLQDRAAFVVVSPDAPDVQRDFAHSRGWNFRMVSCDKRFASDMGFWKEGEGYWPGVSAFVKVPDGTIRRTGKSFFGPGDDFCAVWPLFDLLEGGAGDWEPKYDY